MRGGRARRRRLAWPLGILDATAILVACLRIAIAIETFRKQRGRYPTDEEGSQYLIQEGFWSTNAPDGLTP